MVDLSYRIGQTYARVSTIKGLHFGVEVEMEGGNLPTVETLMETKNNVWNYHSDGSLRGESAEYVFIRPLKPADAHAAVEMLYDLFKAHKSYLSPSYRTSTHVHVNVSDLSWTKVCNIVTAWCIIESLAVGWCAPRRSGNLFCIPFRVASEPIQQLADGLKRYPSHPELQENSLKYAALNLYTLRKFGTLEFRPLEGLSSPEKLHVWLDFLENLYNVALSYEDSKAILADFSANPSVVLAQKFLGPLWGEVSEKHTLHQILMSMQEGVWSVQDLVYTLDWSPLPQKEEPVPTLKPKKKVIGDDQWVVLNNFRDIRPQAVGGVWDAADFAEIERVFINNLGRAPNNGE